MSEAAWHATRPAVPATMFVLVGPPIAPGFDLADLATGGRDVIGSEGFERLEPLTDEPEVPAPEAPAPGTP